MAEPTPIRLPSPQSANDRIRSLQKALEAELELLEQRTLDRLHEAALEASHAAKEITKTGISQELSKLSATILDSVLRMQAIRSR